MAVFVNKCTSVKESLLHITKFLCINFVRDKVVRHLLAIYPCKNGSWETSASTWKFGRNWPCETLKMINAWSCHASTCFILIPKIIDSFIDPFFYSLPTRWPIKSSSLSFCNDSYKSLTDLNKCWTLLTSDESPVIHLHLAVDVYNLYAYLIKIVW